MDRIYTNPSAANSLFIISAAWPVVTDSPLMMTKIIWIAFLAVLASALEEEKNLQRTDVDVMKNSLHKEDGEKTMIVNDNDAFHNHEWNMAQLKRIFAQKRKDKLKKSRLQRKQSRTRAAIAKMRKLYKEMMIKNAHLTGEPAQQSNPTKQVQVKPSSIASTTPRTSVHTFHKIRNDNSQTSVFPHPKPVRVYPTTKAMTTTTSRPIEWKEIRIIDLRLPKKLYQKLHKVFQAKYKASDIELTPELQREVEKKYTTSALPTSSVYHYVRLEVPEKSYSRRWRFFNRYALQLEESTVKVTHLTSNSDVTAQKHIRIA